MKALTYFTYGPPSVLSFSDVAKPAPKNDEILVEVYSTTVNRTDTGLRSAVYIISRLYTGMRRPKNQIQGCEFAGVVAEIGSDVSKSKVGDRVFGFEDTINGGHAEFLTIKESKMVAKIPESIDFNTAAAATEGANYALFGVKASGLKKGDIAFVNGATGTIGSATIQILTSLGVEVHASARKQHFKIAKELGAKRVVDYEKEDYTDTEHRYDAVCDAVGKSRFKIARKILKPTGTYQSSELGPKAENPLLALRSKIYGKQKVLFPIPNNSVVHIQEITKILKSGDFKPLIDSVRDFEDIIEATHYVESEQKVGSVVISIKNRLI